MCVSLDSVSCFLQKAIKKFTDKVKNNNVFDNSKKCYAKQRDVKSDMMLSVTILPRDQSEEVYGAK